MYQFLFVGIAPLKRYPTKLSVSPWLRSFGSGNELKYFSMTELTPIPSGSIDWICAAFKVATEPRLVLTTFTLGLPGAHSGSPLLHTYRIEPARKLSLGTMRKTLDSSRCLAAS